MEKEEHSSIAVGRRDCKLVQPFWKVIWWFLRKLKIVLPEDPDVQLSGIYLKYGPPYYKDPCSTIFIAVLFVLARNRKQSRCPSTEEKKKKTWFI